METVTIVRCKQRQRMAFLGYRHHGCIRCNGGGSLFLVGRQKCSHLQPQYRNALEEWQTGNFVRKPFEGEKYSKCYAEIQDYILDRLENDPLGEQAASHLGSWASERYVKLLALQTN